MKLVLLRHGATEWSVTGQHTGTTDIPLTEDGLSQAAVAGRAMARILGNTMATAEVFSSPLGRAQSTARIVFGDARTLQMTDDLLEFNYGDYEGMTPAQIREIRPGWDIWRDGCPGGETCADVGRRVDHFISRVEELMPVVVAVAHGHLIRILAARAVGLGPENGAIFTLDTATISVIEDVRGKRVLRLWNLDPSLFV